MDFYSKVGKLALGSRLRRLSEMHTEQSSFIYGLYDIAMQPKWFPVFYSLASGEEKSITHIAQEIGHSHPSVSTIAKEMLKAGLICESENKADGRKSYIKMTDKGLSINEKIQDQYMDINSAMEKALSETQHNIWKAIEEWEFILNQKSLLNRVKEEKKRREGEEVKIIDFDPQYQQIFRQLNVEWITTHFKMEEADYISLDNPQDYILNKGGYILFALYKNKPVGTCALIKKDGQTFELAKMAVSSNAKGKGIGFLLGLAAKEKARLAGAKKLYLESNTILKPAINLYHKLGFKKVTGIPSPYERCNKQMELNL